VKTKYNNITLKKMLSRLNEFKNAVAGLTVSDVQNAINFPAWCEAWGNYVAGVSTFDRPPVKPPHA
jgi:hypothetical protein